MKRRIGRLASIVLSGVAISCSGDAVQEPVAPLRRVATAMDSTKEMLTRQLALMDEFSTLMARSASQWIDTVSEWLAARTEHEIRSHFGLKDGGAVALKSRLFVVGRFAAHFSDHGPPHERAAWGIWPQIANLFADAASNPKDSGKLDDNPIGWLDEGLRRESPFAKGQSGQGVRGETIVIGGVRLVVRQPDSDS